MGKTIVISSHILAELEDMCTDVAIIARGRVEAAGSTKELATNFGLQRRVRVRLLDGREEEFPVSSDEHAQAMLRSFVVDQNLPVIEFTTVGTGLEDLFLKVVNQQSPGLQPTDGPPIGALPADNASATVATVATVATAATEGVTP